MLGAVDVTRFEMGLMSGSLDDTKTFLYPSILMSKVPVVSKIKSTLHVEDMVVLKGE